MESRTYDICGKAVKVTDKKILDIVEKAESLVLSPNQAQIQLKEYLLREDHRKHLSLKQYLKNMDLWEAIVTEFYNPTRSRIDSLFEKYAEKHGLSGRFTPEDEEKKRMALLKMSSEKYVNRTDRLAKTENSWDNKKMKNPQIDERYGSVIKGLDETIDEPE